MVLLREWRRSARSRVMGRGLLLGAVLCLGLVCSPQLASAKVLRVPEKLATIQAAVDAARNGDEIRVSPGAYCGATIDKRVELVGVGHPRIIGCASGPVLGVARVGFYLPGPNGKNPASGTQDQRLRLRRSRRFERESSAHFLRHLRALRARHRDLAQSLRRHRASHHLHGRGSLAHRAQSHSRPDSARLQRSMHRRGRHRDPVGA